jgi:tetraacyldisaccharide 4'-kinase
MLILLSYIYTLGHLINYYILQRPKKVNAKVVCIGNVNIGGGGKTPLCLALAELFAQYDKKIAFISRGYKGSLSSWRRAIKVEPQLHNPEQVGDEPLLLAEYAPTYICKNRYFAAQLAVQEGAEVIIMDDGLQNNTLHKDISILVIDGGMASLGNSRVIPAGKLREPLPLALCKVDYCFLLNNNGQDHNLNVKIIEAETKPIITKDLYEANYIGIAGIARPEKFWRSLELAGITVLHKLSFPDHHYFNKSDIDLIEETCRKYGCGIITTAKDFVRLPDSLKSKAKVLHIKIEIPSSKENENVAALLREVIAL